MDNRLDFYNSVKTFTDTFSENDSILVLYRNEDDSDTIINTHGDWQNLTPIFDNKHVSDAPDRKDMREQIRATILTLAFYIISNDEERKNKFVKLLSEFCED
jgi:hypothetical protein